MQSPPFELVLDVLHLGTRNLLRNVGDPDDDTISEITRGMVLAHRAGPALFALGLLAGGVGFWFHICQPRRVKAPP